MKRQDSFSKFDRAKRKVEKLRNFYNHLLIYIVINGVITAFKVSGHLESWNTFADRSLSIDVLSSWLVWGVVLCIHAFSVFIFPKLLGYDWEERKIQQLMQDELQSKK